MARPRSEDNFTDMAFPPSTFDPSFNEEATLNIWPMTPLSFPLGRSPSPGSLNFPFHPATPGMMTFPTDTEFLFNLVVRNTYDAKKPEFDDTSSSSSSDENSPSVPPGGYTSDEFAARDDHSFSNYDINAAQKNYALERSLSTEEVKHAPLQHSHSLSSLNMEGLILSPQVPRNVQQMPVATHSTPVSTSVPRSLSEMPYPTQLIPQQNHDAQIIRSSVSAEAAGGRFISPFSSPSPIRRQQSAPNLHATLAPPSQSPPTRKFVRSTSSNSIRHDPLRRPPLSPEAKQRLKEKFLPQVIKGVMACKMHRWVPELFAPLPAEPNLDLDSWITQQGLIPPTGSPTDIEYFNACNEYITEITVLQNEYVGELERLHHICSIYEQRLEAVLKTQSNIRAVTEQEVYYKVSNLRAKFAVLGGNLCKSVQGTILRRYNQFQERYGSPNHNSC